MFSSQIIKELNSLGGYLLNLVVVKDVNVALRINETGSSVAGFDSYDATIEVVDQFRMSDVISVTFFVAQLSAVQSERIKTLFAPYDRVKASSANAFDFMLERW